VPRVGGVDVNRDFSIIGKRPVVGEAGCRQRFLELGRQIDRQLNRCLAGSRGAGSVGGSARAGAIGAGSNSSATNRIARISAASDG
jgi:hypothetical protein